MANNNAPPDVTAANHAAARYYLVKPREEAIKQYPQLSAAYKVEDALKSTAKEANPLTESVRVNIDNLIKNSVGRSIAAGEVPQDRPAAHEALRVEVAMQSSLHVLGWRKIEPGTSLNITEKHRSLLVNYAESAFTGLKAVDQDPDRRLRAMEVAANIGSLDLPRTANPFAADELKQQYAKRQEHERVQQQTPAPQQTRGNERG